ncbi:hypothetical protein NKJ28_32240 [Mesorhizobium sp. M0145]|uniref:hypothetical protein n=1 Tax=Mesorhizobium sp. M0145 TaxID=2956895 RepID=UPI0033395A77
MQIENVHLPPGNGAFFCADQATILIGAARDGFIHVGELITTGFRSIRIFYELTFNLWEGSEREPGRNLMVSQRGMLKNLFHPESQGYAVARHGKAMRHDRVDAEILTVEKVCAMLPFLDCDTEYFSIPGGLLQRRAGTARQGLRLKDRGIRLSEPIRIIRRAEETFCSFDCLFVK